MDTSLQIALMSLPLLVGAILVHQSCKRKPVDVLDDLLEGLEGDSSENGTGKMSTGNTLKGTVLGDELADAGFIEVKERNRFLLLLKLFPLGVSFAFLGISSIVSGKATTMIMAGIFGLALGFIWSRILLRIKRAKYHRDLEFYLPVVMERIVMAVEAGLDIIPAVGVAIEPIDEEGAKSTNNKIDPVSQLLRVVHKLTESGLGFQESLRRVAAQVNSRPLRHAFIHLGVAQAEGGEVIMPLRELSDATQLYYQESVEEEIAKMPAKATMPLLLAFSGLIICFLTSPLMQVLSLVDKSVPK